MSAPSALAQRQLARYRDRVQAVQQPRDDVTRLAAAVQRAEAKLARAGGGAFVGPARLQRELWSAQVALASAIGRQQPAVA